MCWKQEWASAIGNINRALKHVEKAKLKNEKRLARNTTTLERMMKSEKYNKPGSTGPVEALMQKNRNAVTECNEVIRNLKRFRTQLQVMIHTYGIKQKVNPETTNRLMGKCNLCQTEQDTPNQVCNTAPFCAWRS